MRRTGTYTEVAGGWGRGGYGLISLYLPPVIIFLEMRYYINPLSEVRLNFIENRLLGAFPWLSENDHNFQILSWVAYHSFEWKVQLQFAEPKWITTLRYNNLHIIFPPFVFWKLDKVGSRGRRGEKDLKRDGGLLRHSRETTKTVLWNFSVFIFLGDTKENFFLIPPRP